MAEPDVKTIWSSQSATASHTFQALDKHISLQITVASATVAVVTSLDSAYTNENTVTAYTANAHVTLNGNDSAYWKLNASGSGSYTVKMWFTPAI